MKIEEREYKDLKVKDVCLIQNQNGNMGQLEVVYLIDGYICWRDTKDNILWDEISVLEAKKTTLIGVIK